MPIVRDPEGLGLSLGSFLAGLSGLLFWCVPGGGLFLGVMAVLMGVLSRIHDNPKTLKRAQAGIIMGIVSIIISILLWGGIYLFYFMNT